MVFSWTKLNKTNSLAFKNDLSASKSLPYITFSRSLHRNFSRGKVFIILCLLWWRILPPRKIVEQAYFSLTSKWIPVVRTFLPGSFFSVIRGRKFGSSTSLFATNSRAKEKKHACPETEPKTVEKSSHRHPLCTWSETMARRVPHKNEPRNECISEPESSALQ